MGSDMYHWELRLGGEDEYIMKKGIREGFDRAIRIALEKKAPPRIIKALEKARKELE